MGRAARSTSPPPRPPQLAAIPGAITFIKECAAALLRCSRGKAAICIGGRAGLRDGDAVLSAGRIVTATGAALFCENAFARLDRGAGLPAVQRLPYFPQDAAAALAKYECLVLVDVRRPVANFGYDGGTSQLVQQADSQIWELDAAAVDVAAALHILSKEVGGGTVEPLKNCRGMFCSPVRPEMPCGKLNATSLCHIVAALQPAGAIIVDESLTSGNAYWEASRGCPPFSHLTLTGGAIGCGPPLAVGAAVACVTRPVINLQADGSGMYSIQALWTRAREGLHVVTIVCANRTYAILKVEMAKQRIAPRYVSEALPCCALNGAGVHPRHAAPALQQWPGSQGSHGDRKPCHRLGCPGQGVCGREGSRHVPRAFAHLLAAAMQGMGVAASRATTCEELAEQLTAALDRSAGPSLIEACI